MEEIEDNESAIDLPTRALLRKNAFHFAMRIEEKNNRGGEIPLSNVLSTASIIEKWMCGDVEYPIKMRDTPL